jgi:hypothetical protein
MRVTIPGNFRNLTVVGGNLSVQPNINCVDFLSLFSLPSGVYASYTQGTTQIDTTNLQGPRQNQNWSLESVSIQAGLSFSNLLDLGQLGQALPSGKFGKIYAGIILTAGAYSQTQSGLSPGVSPVQSLPTDSTLVTTLWDPTVDDMPPSTTVFEDFISNSLQLETVIIPSFPVDIVPGSPPLLGIWMEPSVYAVNNPGSSEPTYQIGLIISSAQYAISYDDGLG